MSTVIPFRPRHEFDAEMNLKDFIHHARTRLDLYGSDLDWDADRWDVTSRHAQRGVYSKSRTMTFSALGSTRGEFVPMHRAYVDFAKAFMRHEMTFSGDKNYDNTLAAVRVLEAALIACSPDKVPRVHLTNETVADQALTIIEQHYGTPATRYQYSWQLRYLVEFLVKHNLVATPFTWHRKLRPPEVGNLIGEEHDKRRAAKMPSREVLMAVGQIFDRATEARDVLATSCMALLCSAPSRISEVVTTQNHCEVWLDNADGTKDLGLRWYPAKGGRKGVKPVVKTMEQVAQRALERVRALTEEARTIARWYELHPDRIYLPEELEYMRGKEFITGEDLSRLIGSKDPAYTPKIARQYGLTIHKTMVMLPNRLRKDGTRSESRKQMNVYAFAEVEKKILSYLPPGFPWMDEENKVKFSEGLFVTLRGTFNPSQGTMPCMFMPVAISVILHQFADYSESNNIFKRFGFTNPDGSIMRMPTHQARHWLNTIAERGGLSDIERDMWSGRVTSPTLNGEPGPVGRQSLSYLHSTTDELMEASGLKSDDTDMSGSFVAAVEALPVTREEFIALEDKPTVHVTEFGVCFHDFAMQPCSVHADCLNCMEHACIKGQRAKAERIRDCHAIAVEQLESARQMVEQKYLMAEPWFQHQALTIKRLEALLKLLDDDSLPADTVIMLVNPFQYSAFRNAVTDRARIVGDAESLQLVSALNMPLQALDSALQLASVGFGR